MANIDAHGCWQTRPYKEQTSLNNRFHEKSPPIFLISVLQSTFMAINETKKNSITLYPQNWRDVALLDSGAGARLEQVGPYRLIRPEAEALWSRRLPPAEWSAADAEFTPGSEENGGHWNFRRRIPDEWIVNYQNLKIQIRTSASRHIGLFPEQACHWDWVDEILKKAGNQARVLNLFGYTGLATLAAAAAGAQVVHLDASPKAIAWARQNLALSGLSDAPIRWIIDDAIKFTGREARRNSRYHGIILDPPKFGRGPRGEIWDFYKNMPELLQNCRQILEKRPLFLVMTAYATKASPVTLIQALEEILPAGMGTWEYGELALREKQEGRLLPTAVFARWRADLR